MEACASGPLTDLNDYVRRVEAVSKIDNPSMLESANRVIRILKDEVKSAIDTSLFKEQAEKMLFEAIKTVETSQGYEKCLNALTNINSAVEKFFADVLVMDKDEKIKNNRLALISKLKEKYDHICDFSKL